jgi:hypothetical protein
MSAGANSAAVWQEQLRLLGRLPDNDNPDDRAPLELIGIVFSGETGFGDFRIKVYRSTAVDNCRAGSAMELAVDNACGFVPHVEHIGDRLIIHQAGAAESTALLDLLPVARRLARGEIAQAAAEASALGLGLYLPAKADMRNGADRARK